MVEADTSSCPQKPVLFFLHSHRVPAGHMTALLRLHFSGFIATKVVTRLHSCQWNENKVMCAINCLEENPWSPFPPFPPFQWAFGHGLTQL